MDTVSDEALVIAARSGNQSAFASLVQRYSVAVRSVGFHILRDYHKSEDVAQETFIVAYQQVASLRMPSLFGRWILTIARHQALRVAGSRKQDLSLEHAADVIHAEQVEDDAGHLMSEVMRLPERERRLVMLRYFNGHSVEEIARITGRPVGTVTKQLSRGYTRLRERLVEALI